MVLVSIAKRQCIGINHGLKMKRKVVLFGCARITVFPATCAENEEGGTYKKQPVAFINGMVHGVDLKV